MKYRNHKYTWSKPYECVSHSWELISAHGGVTFHASLMEGREPSVGLEFHSIHPHGDDAPDRVNCNVTGGRCWHDGTSLYARETLWPRIEPDLKRGDHEAIFRRLEMEAKRLEEYAPGYQAEP